MNWEKIRKNKYVEKVIALFKQGLTPRDMAMSIAVGMLIGVIPLFGVTTVLITTLAVCLRLNLPMSLFFTYAVGPIHLLLFIPFIRIGEYVYGVEHTLLTFTAIKEAFQTDYFDALYRLSLEVVCGLSGWTIAAIPSAVVIFFLLWGIFSTFSKNNKQSLSSVVEE